MPFHTTGHLVGHKTLKDELYIDTKAYKFTTFYDFESLFVLSYYNACPHYL